MFSRFTASSRRVMQRAFREAKRWQHDFVGTEHLLYGLLCEAEGPVGSLLRSLNAAPELILQKAELSLQRHSADTAMEQFPLSPATKRAFRNADDEAARLHQGLIGAEHLLLGILRERDCEAAQILWAHGVTWEAAHAAVARIPAEAYGEAQIAADEAPRFRVADNPSADELEQWIAPVQVHDEFDARQYWTQSMQAVDSHMFGAQASLGGLMGYAFGHWAFGWWAGILFALLAMLLVAARPRPWMCAVVCSLFPTMSLASRDWHLEDSWAFAVVMGAGFVMGLYLGSPWLGGKPNFAPRNTVSADNPSAPESPRDAGENRDRHEIRSRP